VNEALLLYKYRGDSLNFLLLCLPAKKETGGNMGSPDGSSSECISKTMNQNEQEEPDPNLSTHAAAALSQSLI